jgi:hypothetical protein
LPKQLARCFVKALTDDITVKKEPALHSAFQFRVHGEEKPVAMQANTGLTRFVQGLTVDDLRGQDGCSQESGQAEGS